MPYNLRCDFASGSVTGLGFGLVRSHFRHRPHLYPDAGAQDGPHLSRSAGSIRADPDLFSRLLSRDLTVAPIRVARPCLSAHTLHHHRAALRHPMPTDWRVRTIWPCAPAHCRGSFLVAGRCADLTSRHRADDQLRRGCWQRAIPTRDTAARACRDSGHLHDLPGHLAIRPAGLAHVDPRGVAARSAFAILAGLLFGAAHLSRSPHLC